MKQAFQHSRRGNWRFSLSEGAGPDLVLAFSSVGHDPDEMPSPEFLTSASAGGQRRVLCIADRGRSWGQDPGFAPALKRQVAQLEPKGRVLAIGSSMGGCLALQAATVLPLSAVLAFGPQWALGPDCPDETRWPLWRAGLRAGAGARAFWPPPEGVAVTLLHGLKDDLAQARAFPAQPGVDHLLFAEESHSDLALNLRARGLLGGLTEAAIGHDRRRLLRLASSAGGISRKRLWRGTAG
ncbi:alpha/beta fold hydrolase [Falsigemmobacter faecalis]|uniref:Alpha/beta hydrolase n=1 Tax=Falsigemmobacter faecalis TaxID=2488730 RepID=A0A3P3DRP8_9RHOB|nr:alpha/beta hydrolase [Falsigemmobacter faecalis]RRH76366.1 hypothetical protein EG244_06310 [Falsigemmobacter faecalis]